MGLIKVICSLCMAEFNIIKAQQAKTSLKTLLMCNGNVCFTHTPTVCVCVSVLSILEKSHETK